MTGTVSTSAVRKPVDRPVRWDGLASCSRCGGTGIYSQFHGVCYRCGGNGVDPTEKTWVFPLDWSDDQVAAWNAERVAKNAASRTKAHARKVDAAKAAWAANVAVWPLLADADAAIAGAAQVGGFIFDVVTKARKWQLSEKQGAAFSRAFTDWQARTAEWAAEAAAAADAPSGRTVVTGTVLTTKWVDSQWGSTQKMTVKDDSGFRVWVSVPKGLTVDVGDRVTFTATLTPSDDDAAFAWAKRPTKANVLATTDNSLEEAA